VSRGKGKKSRLRVLPLDRFDEGFRGHREDGVACAAGDHFVRIAREDGKDFRAVRRQKMRAAGANGQLALARGAPVPKILYDFSA